jgi:hypothetical protein
VEGLVYLLCAATALACTILLLRGFRRSRARLLLWCGLFFLALTLENAILFVDLAILGEDVNLLTLRRTVGLVGVVVLLYGLIWDAE